MGSENCSSCKDWHPIDVSNEGGFDDKLPRATETGEQAGACFFLWPTRGEKPERDGAVLHSYETVHLVTGPDFGCAKWNHPSPESNPLKALL